jgi:ribosomal-protein-alanine N-acetyltransferase
MAFFRTVSSSDSLPAITGPGVTLRVPQSGDFAEWAALRESSRAFLVPWEPTWPSDDLTRGAFRRRLKRYLTAAMRGLVPFCFGTLRLHRLEAACIPGNAASIRLLEKTGFQREGYARSYLCINGVWQDHLLYARLKDEAD